MSKVEYQILINQCAIMTFLLVSHLESMSCQTEELFDTVSDQIKKTGELIKEVGETE